MTLHEAAMSVVRACRHQGECMEDYEEWAEYREQITGYLIDRIAQGSSVTIYGAGYCNDIDLRRLKDHTGHITLADINKPALEAACRKYGLSDSEAVCVQTDLAPIPEDIYVEFARRCLKLCLMSRDAEQLSTFERQMGTEASRETCITDILVWLADVYEKYAASPSEADTPEHDEALEADNPEHDEALEADNPEHDEALKADNPEHDEALEADNPEHDEALKADNAVVLGLHSQLNNVFSAIITVLSEEGYEKQLGGLLEPVMELQRKYTPQIVHAADKRVVMNTADKCFFGYETGPIDGACQVPESILTLCREGSCTVTEAARVMWPFSSARGAAYEMELCEVCTGQ